MYCPESLLVFVRDLDSTAPEGSDKAEIGTER